MLDFEQSSPDELVQPAVLLTIICEAVLKDSVVSLLKNLKVQGYTVTEVAGEGRQEFVGKADDGERKIVVTQVPLQTEVRALVSKDLSNVILYTLKEQQRHFTILAYRQMVEALAND
jgi:nitrogen regulatory protein PII